MLSLDKTLPNNTAIQLPKTSLIKSDNGEKRVRCLSTAMISNNKDKQ